MVPPFFPTETNENVTLSSETHSNLPNGEVTMSTCAKLEIIPPGRRQLCRYGVLILLRYRVY